MNVSIELPEIEGFEPAEGKQPRKAKSGDWCMHLCSTEPFEHKGLESAGKLIILKKKAPVYYTEFTSVYQVGSVKMVEIKALEDAMELIKSWPASAKPMIVALKELIK